jgi:hypothetical protein
LVAEATDIWIGSRLIFPENLETTDTSDWRTDVLLKSRDDVLAAEISRTHWNGSRIVVVNNGSWLLNVPLVNHQHRQLAGRLVRDRGQGGEVVFLESGVGGPSVAATGPRRHHGLEAFTVWPINVILLHLTASGILYCFSVFPVFGRAKRLPARDNSDFGRHITALGELLARTGDEDFARRQIAQCQQLMADLPTHGVPTQGGTTTAVASSVVPNQPTAASWTMASQDSRATNRGELPHETNDRVEGSP